ncbi:MAG TPA: hypothetical protein VEK73_02415 [Xanthobacteraceae bacterium]|nr:hypothetical protein [Xanthobacteraceae bacterium]
MCVGIAGSWGPAYGREAKKAETPAKCKKFHIKDTASKSLQPWTQPADGSCSVRTAAGGFLLPDPKCTPGAFNPTMTAKILRTKGFTTKCLRDDVTTEKEKATTYEWYGIPHPSDNEGKNQTCELDHLISLELGGADGLDNIWPQCGPDGVTLDERYFKQKDKVENYLAEMVKAGKIDLNVARKGIATDWTQYLDAAKEACKSEKCEIK